MSKAGQNNQAGIFAQNWAAFSLFLQFLRDSNFSYIQIEPENSEDFDLVFQNGRRIICESKYRKIKFGRRQLKELLKKVLQRGSMDAGDQVLVVCKNLSEDLESEIKNAIFFEDLRKKFKKAGFNNSMIELFSKVNFWVLGDSIDKNLNYYLVSDLINMWLPPEEIVRFADATLQKEIFRRATAGGVYSRQDFYKDVENLKQEVQKRSDFFSMKNKKDKQFRILEREIIKKKRTTWGTGSVSAFSAQWDLMSFAIDRLKTKPNINLREWDDLWQLNRVHYFSFGIFDVFSKNLLSPKNREYVIDYIKKHTKTIRGFYRSDYFYIDVVKILTKIIEEENTNHYLNDIFSIIKDLITFNEKKFFYLREDSRDHHDWEKEEITKLLYKVYKKSDNKLRKKILNLAITGFNLTEDQGEFNHHTPQEVFDIIRDWLREDFVQRIGKVTNIIVDQYKRFYGRFNKKKNIFEGWELMGHSTSYSGYYHISDRHFVRYVLKPATEEYYHQNQIIAWQLILEKMVSKADREISDLRPDFLNRAVYQIVLARYANSHMDISEEAFDILRGFLVTKRGIPHKAELIYQALVGMDIDDDKKWRLIEVLAKKYDIPVNPFVEQIVSDLSNKGFPAARDQLKKWLVTSKYYTGFRFEREALRSIRSLLETDTKFAISLFKVFIDSEHVNTSKKDYFEAYDVAALLYEILKKDYNEGIGVLRKLEEDSHPNIYKQIIYTFSLFNNRGNDESDDAPLLERIYTEVIDPLLTRMDNDITKITKRFSADNCRSAFVQFASRLTDKKRIPEALRIIRIFINDPDPYLPGQDVNDPKNEYSEHLSVVNGKEPSAIISVRGWCGWALVKCAGLESREYIPELIELTKKLSEDQNYYVMHMSCFPLSLLARNRLSVLPSDSTKLFFHDNIEKALTMSKDVEKIAFALLTRLEYFPKLVQMALIKSVLSVFEHIRSLNQQDAWLLIKTLASLPEETLKESAPLFIYFSNFREHNYMKDWKWKIHGLYDDLEEWNSGPFEEITQKIIREVHDPDNLYKFAASCEHLVRQGLLNEKEENIQVALKYFNILADRYSHSVFQVIYMAINRQLGGDNHYDEWYSLYIKCLKTEFDFYQKTLADPGNSQEEKLRGMYWWPYYDNFEIIEKVHQIKGKEQFLVTASLIFDFPSEFEIHITETAEKLIKKYRKDSRAKKMLNDLFKKNPSKYWDLKKEKI